MLFDWPGLGAVPPDPRIRGIDGLIALVLDRMDRPVDLVAQSMGGIIAVRAALARPEMVRRLVLTATSGGIDVARFSALDWRPEYRAEFPSAASWILDYRADLSDQIALIRAPTLLVWGDSDPISPIAVGEFLASLLPHARLVVVKGGDHAFAQDRPAEVASLVTEHLGAGSAGSLV